MKTLYYNIRKSDIGVKIAIFAYVSAQFIEVILFNLGGIPISVQKILAIMLFPLSLLLIGCIRINWHLILFGFLISFCYSISYILHFNGTSELVSANIIVFMGATGAIVLYTALTESTNSISTLAHIWIGFSLITSLIVILQAVNVVPLFKGPDIVNHLRVSNNLYRGIGFKTGPNFQALMLIIGVVFTQFFMFKFRFIVTSIIMLGVIGTFSRMGLILFFLVIILHPIVELIECKKNIFKVLIRIFLILIFMITFVLIIYIWGPIEIKKYLIARFERILEFFKRLMLYKKIDVNGHLSSAETRFILARTALIAGLKNWFSGVGAFQTPSTIFKLSGIRQVSHNTYLEFFLIGGIWGLLPLLLFTYIFLKFIVRRSFKAFSVQRSCVIILVLMFAATGLFLSITYNSILWLPIVLILATQKNQYKFRKHLINNMELK